MEKQSALHGVIEQLRANRPISSAAINEIENLLQILQDNGWSGFIPADEALRALTAFRVPCPHVAKGSPIAVEATTTTGNLGLFCDSCATASMGNSMARFVVGLMDEVELNQSREDAAAHPVYGPFDTYEKAEAVARKLSSDPKEGVVMQLREFEPPWDKK